MKWRDDGRLEYREKLRSLNERHHVRHDSQVSPGSDQTRGKSIDNLQEAEKMKHHTAVDENVEVDGRVVFEHETIDRNTR